MILIAIFISFKDFKIRANGALNMLNDKADTFQSELIALIVKLPEIKNYSIDMPCMKVLASLSGWLHLTFLRRSIVMGD